MWRGTLVNELMSLPIYWWKVFRVATPEQLVDKIKYGEHGRQYYLWARPPAVSKARVVIYLHGGGWWLGKPEQFVQNAQFFTSLGYAVYMPSYRRVPKYNIEDIKADLVAALRAIKSQLKTKDFPEILLAGMSAGGHLAALLALDKSLFAEAGWPHENIAGLVSWCGPLDLDNTDPSLPQYWLLRNLEVDKKALGNPKVFLKNQKPTFPMVVFHGTKDGMINNNSAQHFLQACEANELPVVQSILPHTHLEIATWSIPHSKFWHLSRKLLAASKLIDIS